MGIRLLRTSRGHATVVGAGNSGTDFNYLIHRTLARLPYPDGKLRSTVLVLEANINRRVLGVIARTTTGVRFRVRDIDLIDLGDSWSVRMKEGQEVFYEAEIYKHSIGARIDARSQFKSANEADRFLLGISFGAQWEPEAQQIKLLAETHDPWQTSVGQCTTIRHALLKSLGVQEFTADHVITMTNIPHYFALRGLIVACPSSSTQKVASSGY